MSRAEFVHLHNHTEYSLLNALARITDDKGNPSDLIKQVASWKMPSLAITDSGNMYGAVEFYSACTEAGINPILGTEAYMAPASRLDRKGAPSEAATPVVLLAENETGYKNLMRLATRAFLEGMYYKPRIDREILKEHAKGVIALSGPLRAEIPSALLRGETDRAEALVAEYRSILGPENFFIELWDHGLPAEKKVLPMLLELAKKTGTPVVATNDCYYFRKDDAVAHDVLLCIGMGKTVDDEARPRFAAPEYYYKSPDEMLAIFKDLPEATKNTLAIADRCRVQLRFDQILLPRYDVPSGETPDTYLEKLCLEGLKNRFGRITPEYKARLDAELAVIFKMGFSTYFLIVWDFIRHAKENGVPVGPGRGSGAGAVTAYALGITNIDPITNGLLFERFLNPERRSMPDLDIDFADDGREMVIQYVRKKYGETCVAQIITFGAMLARLVVRDVGRALGMPLPDVDKIARMIPKELGITLHGALESTPELKEAVKDPQVKRLFELSKKLEGIKRHTGVHAAGTIIAAGEITEHVPLARGSRDVVTTQYNDENSLKLGLLKVDFLGLRTLRIIRDAVLFVRKRHEPAFDIEKIPLDDGPTYKLLSSGKTAAIFQVESGGMRDLLRKLRPSTIEDVVALISLYRPGPMGSGMLDEFVGRKHGKIKVKYDHPVLEPILKDTYGVIVYQEQVMRVAQSMGGYTQGESDSLRKAMGKKIPEIIEKQRDKFVGGSVKNGVDKKIAEKVFDLMVQFGGYGFNKSHASAYGLVSYQTAFLKANFPVEFMAAVLTSEIGHSNLGSKEIESKLVAYINDAQEMGVDVRGPDVNASDAVFSVENAPEDKKNPAIRFGLTAVKNVGEGAVASVLAARAEGGPFKSLDDFCSRVDGRQVNKKVLESLVKGGAFDGFRPALEHEAEEVRLLELCRWRAQLFDETGDVLNRAAAVKEEAAAGQSSLFDLGGIVGARKGGAALAVAGAPAAVKSGGEWSEHELLANEKEVLGFYISGHPLARYRKEIKSYTSHNLGNLPEGGLARIAGMIVNTKKVVTKTGHPMCRFKLEDLEGEVECVVFPKTFTPEVAKILVAHEMVVLKGKIEPRDDGKNVLVEEIVTLKDARDRYVKSVVLMLSTAGLEEELLARIEKSAAGHPGKCPLAFRLKTPTHGDFGLVTEKKVAPTDGFLHEIDKILGPGAWELKA